MVTEKKRAEVKKSEEIFEQLYREMFDKLLAYAQSSLTDRHLAEEAVQDTFRIAWIKVDDLRTSPNPQGWLTNTLKNVMRNMKRSRARLSNIVIGTLTYDEQTMGASKDEMDVDLLYSNIAASSEFKLIKKIALDSCTMIEMSEELGISIEACKKRVQRARKTLQKSFLEK